MNLTLQVWRQKSRDAEGGFVEYKAENISPDASFLEMLDVVNERLIEKGEEPIHFEPNHKEYVRTYKWLKRDGVISRKLRLEKSRDKATVLVLTHERRWGTYPKLLDEHRQLQQVHEVRIDGVPLYTVYRRR